MTSGTGASNFAVGNHTHNAWVSYFDWSSGEQYIKVLYNSSINLAMLKVYLTGKSVTSGKTYSLKTNGTLVETKDTLTENPRLLFNLEHGAPPSNFSVPLSLYNHGSPAGIIKDGDIRFHTNVTNSNTDINAYAIYWSY